jgi:hypothetical protein
VAALLRRSISGLKSVFVTNIFGYAALLYRIKILIIYWFTLTLKGIEMIMFFLLVFKKVTSLLWC